MDIQFINITSFIGISANAVHYYAKLLDTKYLEEYLMDTNEMDNLCDGTGEEMRYTPTEDEARAMAAADYPDMDLTLTPEKRKAFREIAEGDYLEYGTTRFPSILRIIQETRKRFPDSALFFTLYGSRKSFMKAISKDIKDPESGMLRLLVPKREK